MSQRVASVSGKFVCRMRRAACTGYTAVICIHTHSRSLRVVAASRAAHKRDFICAYLPGRRNGPTFTLRLLPSTESHLYI